MQRWIGATCAAFAAALAAWFVSQLFVPAQGVSIPWIPALGIDTVFIFDGLSLFFALLITGIGSLVFLYSGGYMAGEKHVLRFHLYLILFMLSMLGVVLSGNLLLTYVFWELTSLTSFLLIGFEHESQEARDAAVQAWLITGLGGLAMLGGIVLLGTAAGTYNIAELPGREALVQTWQYPYAVVLILLGALTKSAQFPFHIWLPAAMTAPTPVSAYLHSATMVKAGIFLIARLHSSLSGSDLWFSILVTAGAATTLAGAWFSLFQTDLKRILAYATVSALGVAVFLLAFDTQEAIAAVLVWLLAHALYKGGLFMVAGIIDHATDTRDVTQLGGLRGKLPLAAIGGAGTALSMMGLPPLFGFVGKEEVIKDLVNHGITWLTALFIASAAMLVTAALNTGWRPFAGQDNYNYSEVHKPSFDLWLGPLLLAVAGLVAALWIGPVGTALVEPGVTAVLGRSSELHLKLWHGFNLPLALSVVSISVGITLYAVWPGVRESGRRLFPKGGLAPRYWYDHVLAGADWLSRQSERAFQSGYLRMYVLTLVAVTTTMAAISLYRSGSLQPLAISYFQTHEALLCMIIIAGAISTVLARKAISAICSLSVVGLGIAVFYLLFAAPDLAMTQFAAETLVVIVFVLCVLRMPNYVFASGRHVRFRDATVAALAGLVLSLLVLLANNFEPNRSVSQAYLNLSKPEAHGANVVNVILVDFRALDTLGEVSVLVIAAVGVFALLRLRKGQSA